MKQFFTLLLGIICSQFVNAQKIYFYSGQNQVTYNYKISSKEYLQPFLNSDNGLYFELGYEQDFAKNWIYRGGISLNQFNNRGGNELNYYQWKTSYLGIENLIGYTLFRKKAFRSILSAGLGFSTIVDGFQQFNDSFYLVKNGDDFKGIFISPQLGFELRYNLKDLLELSLRYDYSHALNLEKSDKNSERLSFTNNQLSVGIHVPLIKSARIVKEEQRLEAVDQLEIELADLNKKQQAMMPRMDSLIRQRDMAMREREEEMKRNAKMEEVDKRPPIIQQVNSGYVSAYFDTNQVHPTKASAGAINNILTYMRSNPTSTVKIFGNADEIGDPEYNRKLALERAKNMKLILVSAGIQEDRISIVSNGEDTSVDKKSAEARSLVRKVTFQIE